MTSADRDRDIADSLAKLLYPHGEWPADRHSFLMDRLAALDTIVLVARISGSNDLHLLKAIRSLLEALLGVTRLQMASAQMSVDPSQGHQGAGQ